MNLVVAIDMSSDMHAALRASKQALVDAGVTAAIVPDENHILPIVSLPGIEDGQIEMVTSALMYSVEDIPAFRITLGHIDQIDDALVQTVVSPARINRLYRSVILELEGVGIELPLTVYEPRVTLAQKVTNVPDATIERGRAKSRVRSISLLREVEKDGALHYETVYTVCLLKNYRRPEERMLFLDCDSCPYTREAIAEARRRKTHVAAFVTGETNINRFLRRNDPRLPRKGFWCATINVEGEGDSSESRIRTLCKAGDVVVTNNKELAKYCYNNGCFVMNSHSERFDSRSATGETSWFSLQPGERLNFDAADLDTFGKTLSGALRFEWVGRVRPSKDANE